MTGEEIIATIINWFRRKPEDSEVERLSSQRLRLEEDAGSQDIAAGASWYPTATRMYWICNANADVDLEMRVGGTYQEAQGGVAAPGTQYFIIQKYAAGVDGNWRMKNDGGSTRTVHFSWREYDP